MATTVLRVGGPGNGSDVGFVLDHDGGAVLDHDGVEVWSSGGRAGSFGVEGFFALPTGTTVSLVPHSGSARVLLAQLPLATVRRVVGNSAFTGEPLELGSGTLGVLGQNSLGS